jgi:hypothetical protein
MQLLLLVITGVVAAELLIRLFVKWVRKHFQWLITSEDEIPVLDSKALAKFYITGYDAELGWVRKPNTENKERGKYGATTYHIDSEGARANSEHKHLPLRAICYGDSFTFCRQVNDNETWPWQLSELIQGNIINFGVGNYGLDQAILRMERESLKHIAPITLMGIVPSTIVRILCSWKHYNEYGNTFAFKPRFDLNQEELFLIPNPIDSEVKYSDYARYLPQIRATDYFYKSKFRRELITFPYLYNTLKNPLRNLPIMAAFTAAKLLGSCASQNLKDYPLQKIMQINLNLRVDLFQGKYPLNLLLALVERFKQDVNGYKSAPVFILLPQKDDLLFVKSRYNYYSDAMDKIRKKVHVIDLTDRILAQNDLDTLYSDDGVYGGHLSNAGNALAAKIIYEKLKEFNLI